MSTSDCELEKDLRRFIAYIKLLFESNCVHGVAYVLLLFPQVPHAEGRRDCAQQLNDDYKVAQLGDLFEVARHSQSLA